MNTPCKADFKKSNKFKDEERVLREPIALNQRNRAESYTTLPS
jgi:hypothetical protein